MFQRTTAINKILKLSKFVKGIQGGTSAGKTYGILPILINVAITEPLSDISVVAESIPHLKRGAMKDFKKIMAETKRWYADRWNGTDFKYTFANGSSIEFFSADSDAKLRGARRDYLYMNECNNMTFHAYTELASRTKKAIWLDWNPTNEFWFHKELLGDKDVDFLIINYEDNEACPESALNFILKAKEKSSTSNYWANWYKVYGLGQLGSLQNTIFEFNQVDEIPQEAKFLSYGLDFGFSNDPAACVVVYKSEGELYVDELIYQTGLTNSDLTERFRALGINEYDRIVADSAEPKSIEDIYRNGYKAVEGARKGADSIRNGIDLIRQNKLNVTKKSLNLIKELRGYQWQTDKNGAILPKPNDFNNHCFVGDTLITTNKGQKRIDSINEGDLVLTSKGYKRVLKRWDNGLKQVNNYLMQFDIYSVNLCSTKEHLIKTDNQWIQISELKQGQTVYLVKDLTIKNTIYTQEKNISQKEIGECIQTCGNIITELYPKRITYTTLTKTRGTIELKTLLWLKSINTYQNMANGGLRKIKNGLKTFTQKVLKRQKNGINQKKVYNGIQKTVKKVGIKESIKLNNALSVEKNITQGMVQYQNSAIITAKLNHLEKGENRYEQVYDLFIEGQHEYFANGILVHNCIDALRYVALNVLTANKGEYYII